MGEEKSKIHPRMLTPANAKVFKGRLGSLHCMVDDTEAFANVHCVLCFIISYPDRFISVCYSDDSGKEHEIGVIEDLQVFPREIRELIQENLRHYYYERTLTRIYGTKWEFGMILFDVETTEGRGSFRMYWQYDKALEFGKKGKILLDAFDNRYVIPSIEDLPKADRDRLQRFIYW
jgi:hypothetical protein